MVVQENGNGNIDIDDGIIGSSKQSNGKQRVNISSQVRKSYRKRLVRARYNSHPRLLIHLFFSISPEHAIGGVIRNVHHNNHIIGLVVDVRGSDCCLNEGESTRAPDVLS